MFTVVSSIQSLQAGPEGEGPTEVFFVVGVAFTLAFALLLGLAILRRFLSVCRPNELLVISGKEHRLPTGEIANYTVIQAGSLWRVPFLQSVARMDIRLVPIELAVNKVLSHGGIPLDVHAIANIKITSEPKYIYNAVERFLTLDPQAIYLTAKQTLEGALRDVISQLTPEQVNEDRIAFANRLLEVFGTLRELTGVDLQSILATQAGAR